MKDYDEYVKTKSKTKSNAFSCRIKCPTNCLKMQSIVVQMTVSNLLYVIVP